MIDNKPERRSDEEVKDAIKLLGEAREAFNPGVFEESERLVRELLASPFVGTKHKQAIVASQHKWGIGVLRFALGESAAAIEPDGLSFALGVDLPRRQLFDEVTGSNNYRDTLKAQMDNQGEK